MALLPGITSILVFLHSSTTHTHTQNLKWFRFCNCLCMSSALCVCTMDLNFASDNIYQRRQCSMLSLNIQLKWVYLSLSVRLILFAKAQSQHQLHSSTKWQSIVIHQCECTIAYPFSNVFALISCASILLVWKHLSTYICMCKFYCCDSHKYWLWEIAWDET